MRSKRLGLMARFCRPSLWIGRKAANSLIGLDEGEWRDDAKSIADWIALVDSIEPLVLSDEERVEMERYRAEQRRFNIEAVRQQMQLGEAS